PGRSVARGERHHPRGVVGYDAAGSHAATHPARIVRRLAARFRAGDPGTIGLDPVVFVEFHHAGGRRLQSLRDPLYRNGGGARDGQYGDHRRRDLARLSHWWPLGRIAQRSCARERITGIRDQESGVRGSRTMPITTTTPFLIPDY